MCFTSERLNLPSFELRPENILHKIGSSFGYQGIDFRSHPQFSSSYLLRGNDEAAIHALFTPEVLRYFERQDGLCVEGDGDKLICYRQRKRVDPHEIKSFLDQGRAVLDLFRR